MRRVILLLVLLSPFVIAGCGDVTGVAGGRSVSGVWSGTVDREDIFLTLTEDRGRIQGSGSWGFDAVTVTGNRAGSDISLVFEFFDFEPINLQGTVSGNTIEGWLTGSGFRGDPATLWRD